MRSSLTSALPFLCLTSLAGCDEKVCGPAGAPQDGIGIVGDSPNVTITYGGLESGQNNDCPADPNVVSLTIAGLQIGGTGRFTICVGRPDLLAEGPLDLGIDNAASEARIIDVTGDVDGCTYRFDNTVPPTGTASSEGLCDAGANPAGFALTIDGTLSLVRTCGATIESISVALSGRVAALPQP